MKKPSLLLAQSNITCNCKNQNSFFRESKRKPDFVIKLLHHHAGKIKPSNHYSFIMQILYPKGVLKSKKKMPFDDVSYC
jgi:hypothetical protein